MGGVISVGRGCFEVCGGIGQGCVEACCKGCCEEGCKKCNVDFKFLGALCAGMGTYLWGALTSSTGKDEHHRALSSSSLSTEATLYNFMYYLALVANTGGTVVKTVGNAQSATEVCRSRGDCSTKCQAGVAVAGPLVCGLLGILDKVVPSAMVSAFPPGILLAQGYGVAAMLAHVGASGGSLMLSKQLSKQEDFASFLERIFKINADLFGYLDELGETQKKEALNNLFNFYIMNAVSDLAQEAITNPHLQVACCPILTTADMLQAPHKPDGPANSVRILSLLEGSIERQEWVDNLQNSWGTLREQDALAFIESLATLKSTGETSGSANTSASSSGCCFRFCGHRPPRVGSKEALEKMQEMEQKMEQKIKAMNMERS